MLTPRLTPRILVVGPKYASANSRGGMATLIALMRERDGDRARITTVATYVDAATPVKLAVGVLGMLHSTLLVLARRVDVLHVHLAHGGSVMRKGLPLLAARAVGVPAIIHAHSYNFVAWFDEQPRWMQRIVRRVLVADRWLVLGDALRIGYRDCLRLREDQVLVLRNPVRIPPDPPARTGPVVRAVALGRMGRRKGSYDVVTALAALPADVRSGLEVVLAGDGEVDEVAQAASAAGLDGVLRTRSWIGPAERDELLAASEIFVLPSYDEGLPMALLEAMAWGLALVTTPVGGIGEVVTDGTDAVVVQPGDTAALTAALESLVRDSGQRHAIGNAARERSRDFDVDVWFDTLVEQWTSFSAARR